MDDVQPPPHLPRPPGVSRPQAGLCRLRPGRPLPANRSRRMKTLLDRFCRYVRIDSQADEAATSYPSSPGQLEMGRLLVGELLELGLRDAAQDSHGIVMATVPATMSRPVPTVAWIAHVDTSPETSGRNVKPTVHRNYAGGDLALPGDPTKVIRVADNPELDRLHG